VAKDWKEAREGNSQAKESEPDEPHLIITRPVAARSVAETGGDASETRQRDCNFRDALSTTRLGGKPASRADNAGSVVRTRNASTISPAASSTRPSVNRSPRSSPIVSPPLVVIPLPMPAS
jgi:hypothetical protein